MESRAVPPKGGKWIGVPVAFFFWLLVVATLWAKGMWRFPPVASAHGSEMDSLFRLIFAITGTAFILAQLLLGYFVLRFRSHAEV